MDHSLKKVSESPIIRGTGILIIDHALLLLEQKVDAGVRGWSLPGGTQELGETLEECILREIEEETGLIVSINKLLYVCDRITDSKHVFHITFLLDKIDGELKSSFPNDTIPIKSARMVPIDELAKYGFSQRFIDLIANHFPYTGSYMGAITNIGL